MSYQAPASEEGPNESSNEVEILDDGSIEEPTEVSFHEGPVQSQPGVPIQVVAPPCSSLPPPIQSGPAQSQPGSPAQVLEAPCTSLPPPPLSQPPCQSQETAETKQPAKKVRPAICFDPIPPFPLPPTSYKNEADSVLPWA